MDSSSWAINGNEFRQELEQIKKRVEHTETFIHFQDLKENDILLKADYAKHQGGFAAAKKNIGGQFETFNIDISSKKKIKIRKLKEEISRIVIARAGNDKWVQGMKKHGYRGAAELSETLDNLVLYSQLTNAVSSHIFDIYYEATIGNPEIYKFLEKFNIKALESMRYKFKELYNSKLWITKSNSIAISIHKI